MTKSDRRRVLAALERWEKRYRAETAGDGGGTPATLFAAAVDWLRAEVKLAAEYLDPDDSGWAESGLMDASVLVAGVAKELADEIRKDAKSL